MFVAMDVQLCAFARFYYHLRLCLRYCGMSSQHWNFDVLRYLPSIMQNAKPGGLRNTRLYRIRKRPISLARPRSSGRSRCHCFLCTIDDNDSGFIRLLSCHRAVTGLGPTFAGGFQEMTARFKHDEHNAWQVRITRDRHACNCDSSPAPVFV